MKELVEIARGRIYADIAEELGIPHNAVWNHVHNDEEEKNWKRCPTNWVKWKHVWNSVIPCQYDIFLLMMKMDSVQQKKIAAMAGQLWIPSILPKAHFHSKKITNAW